MFRKLKSNMLIDRNNMHNVQRNFKILIKQNTTRIAATITVLSKNKMYGFDEITHIGMKRKLFG